MCWINNSFYNIQHCNTNIFLFSQSFLVINIPLNVIKPVSRVILLIEDIEITNPFPSNKRKFYGNRPCYQIMRRRMMIT